MNLLKYLADFAYGATKYSCALFKPSVCVGVFGNKPHHQLQEIFYCGLLDLGFKRTFWQLVFPGQIAGLIKKIQVGRGEANEYHIRFYSDGVIECEERAEEIKKLFGSKPFTPTCVRGRNE